MDWLMRWETLVFLAPLGVGIALVAGMAFGGGLDGEADVDADTDVHADVDLSPSHAFLELLGIGRVPLSVVLFSLCVLFGVTGLATTALVEPYAPGFYVLISLVVASLVSVLGTGRIAAVVARYAPTLETYRVGHEDLVGRVGHAIVEITNDDGFAQVKDHEGNLHQVRCRSTGAQLSKSSGLLVLEYNREHSFYLVEPFEPDASDTHSSARPMASVKAGARSRS